MKELVIDRIEEQRYKKGGRFFGRLSIASLLVLTIAIISYPELIAGINGITIPFIILIPILLILFHRIRSQKYGGQFIEWTKNEIAFKARVRKPTQIPLEVISDIDIQLDSIIIILKDGDKKVFDMIDFHDVEDRKKIKSNFEKMKNYA